MLIALYLLSAFYAKTVNMPARRALPPPPRTACAAVTRTEVERAVGRRFNDGAEENSGPASTCDYAIKGGLVSIAIQRLASKPDLAVEIAALKKEAPEGEVRAAPEFGEAFFFDIPGAGTQLHVISGSSAHLMVSILGLGDAAQVSGAAARIARDALRRL